MSKEESKDKAHNKPKWLKRLEKESWQAELLISGIALYGTLQLPQAINWLTDFLITQLETNQYLIAYFIVFGGLFGISLLTSFFIMHFIFRAYWIGLIGLNSVFPEGYYTKDDAVYSPVYLKKYKDILPNIEDSIQKIDKICSTIFSGAFVFIMLYVSISLSIGFLLFINNLLSDFLPSFILKGFIGLLGLAYFVLMILTVVGNIKKYRYNEKIQHRYFKITQIFGYIMSPFLFKPIYQIMMTFNSNAVKGKSKNVLLILSFFLIGVSLTTYQMTTTNIPYLIEKGVNSKSFIMENEISTHNYENLMLDESLLFDPIIQSDVINEPYLRLFVPVFQNEDNIRDNFCEDYKRDKELGLSENSFEKRKYYLECSSKYHQVSINDSIHQIEFYRHHFPKTNQFGLAARIPSSLFLEGKNLLKVTKLKNPAGEVHNEFLIPFWYTAD